MAATQPEIVRAQVSTMGAWFRCEALDGPTANLPYKHLQKMIICLVNGKDGFFVLPAPVKTLLGSGRIRCSRATRLNSK